MKILAGVLHHETNTLTPLTTSIEDFDVAKGDDVLSRIAVTQLFRQNGVEIVPAIYANALPSGVVERSAFEYFCGEILNTISDAMPVDGIWLYLHGAMAAEGIVSGEAHLVSQIRNLVGGEIPIALALDFHANMTETLVDQSNIICGYRTAPHTDQAETQIRAARLLLECLKDGRLPQSAIVRVPVLTPGDVLVTTTDPGRSLIAELAVTDSKDGVLCSSIFGGQPWVDAPNVGMSAVVTAYDKAIAVAESRRLGELCWEARTQLRFEAETAPPEEAVARAFSADDYPVFISDSGDNTTGGAPGDNAYMLGLLLAAGAEDVLVTGITDPDVVKACDSLEIGQTAEFSLGGRLDPIGSRSVTIHGTLRSKGRIEGWFGEDAGQAVVIGTKGIDVLVTEQRCGIVSPAIIESAGLSVHDYKVVVVKLGYLWDALSKVSKRSIIAFTQGATCEDVEQIEYRSIMHPMYPLDGDFEWHA